MRLTGNSRATGLAQNRLSYQPTTENQVIFSEYENKTRDVPQTHQPDMDVAYVQSEMVDESGRQQSLHKGLARENVVGSRQPSFLAESGQNPLMNNNLVRHSNPVSYQQSSEQNLAFTVKN